MLLHSTGLAAILQTVAVFCELCHLHVYRSDGRGLRFRHTWFAADMFSEVCTVYKPKVRVRVRDEAKIRLGLGFGVVILQTLPCVLPEARSVLHILYRTMPHAYREPNQCLVDCLACANKAGPPAWGWVSDRVKGRDRDLDRLATS